jgi:hypothetical protein
MNIKTEWVTILGGFIAWDEDNEECSTVGKGKTPLDAVNDFADQLAERQYDDGIRDGRRATEVHLEVH